MVAEFIDRAFLSMVEVLVEAMGGIVDDAKALKGCEQCQYQRQKGVPEGWVGTQTGHGVTIRC